MPGRLQRFLYDVCVYLRRARPTLRLLREDLGSGWGSPEYLRSLTEGDIEALHPLSELPHPIIVKALNCFGEDGRNDHYVGAVGASAELSLLEIKAGQWRGGVWYDKDHDVCWLLVAGLAKGNHKDHDDFYERIGRESSSYVEWLPTDEDVRLLKRERAAKILSDWELKIQKIIFQNLQIVHGGGSIKFDLPHPDVRKGNIAAVILVISPDRESGVPTDEVNIDIESDSRFLSSNLLWSAVIRVLISLNPPEQDWDRYGNSYSTLMEPGGVAERVAELEKLVNCGALAESAPGEHAHYAHREHIAGSVVDGRAMRALCGAFFVQTQLPDPLPECPSCAQRLNELPAS